MVQICLFHRPINSRKHQHAYRYMPYGKDWKPNESSSEVQSQKGI